VSYANGLEFSWPRNTLESWLSTSTKWDIGRLGSSIGVSKFLLVYAVTTLGRCGIKGRQRQVIGTQQQVA
jgi:hypothetical protein